MTSQVVLIPNRDVRPFLSPLPHVLNEAQGEFEFSVRETPAKDDQSVHDKMADVDKALHYIYTLKTRWKMRDEDLLVWFTDSTLESRKRGLSNLFLAGSNLFENPPRVVAISTAFIRKHILPVDPTYLTQRHAFYHLVVCGLAGSFLDMGAHEDRGCLLDFNSYTPNIHRKIDAGYSFCGPCASLVVQHPLGEAIFNVCDALKLGVSSYSRPAVRESQKRSKVFLCYAGPDREKVFQLYDHLTKDGFKPWMDKKDLIPGQDWQLEIRRTINSADYFVACLSLQFRRRTFGQKEIKLALDVLDTMPEGAIYLIPVRLEDCVIEDRLSGRQWVDLFEPEGYDKLVKALRWSEATAV